MKRGARQVRGRQWPRLVATGRAEAGYYRLRWPLKPITLTCLSEGVTAIHAAKGNQSMSDPKSLAMIERRRIEAAILKNVYDTLKASHGAEVAKRTIAAAVRESAVAQARELAAAVGGKTSLETFIARQEPWLRGGSLDIEVVERSPTRYRYNVTRCKYAEMYREMGLGEIGHLLSCQRDGTFAEGYDSRLKLKRTQTIMQGATHCDFDYSFVDGQPKK